MENPKKVIKRLALILSLISLVIVCIGNFTTAQKYKEWKKTSATVIGNTTVNGKNCASFNYKINETEYNGSLDKCYNKSQNSKMTILYNTTNPIAATSNIFTTLNIYLGINIFIVIILLIINLKKQKNI